MDQAIPLIGGASLGAALMYFFDSQQGRRRAFARDNLTRLSHKACDAADVIARDAANRAAGLLAEALAAVCGRTSDDRTLA